MVRKVIDTEALWRDYVFGKQTLTQLSYHYRVSHDTICRKLDAVHVPRIVSSLKHVVILIDTTYWGRNFGVMVFKDCRAKRSNQIHNEVVN